MITTETRESAQYPETGPACYRERFDRTVAKVGPALAREYVIQAQVGDPPADVVVQELQPRGVTEINRLIRAGMDRDKETLKEAPRSLIDLFEEVNEPPDWWDPKVAQAGIRAFHAHSDLFIPALFVSTVQNASTLIAKSFHATGRVNSQFGPRRIRQNTRHFIEIMMPGGLDREGEGWRLSVRIRLVHAQIRRLILDYGEWDEATFGAPIHAAHLGVAAANFSAGMLRHATALGASLSAEAREGFMHAWRYASWLTGIPERLLFEGNEEKTRELWRTARAIEPPPGEESLVIATALFDALPRIAGKREGKEFDQVRTHAARVTRALIGRKTADRLELARGMPGAMAAMRTRRKLTGQLHKVAPTVAAAWRASAFSFLLDAALLDDLKYTLPDKLKATEATPW